MNKLQLKSGRIINIRTPPLTQDVMMSIVKMEVEAALENPQTFSMLTDEEIEELHDLIIETNTQFWKTRGIKLFKDEALTMPAETVDFGNIWLFEAKTWKGWLWNNTEAYLRDIQVDFTLKGHRDQKACVTVEAPRTLKSLEKAPITFTWHPKTFDNLDAELSIHSLKVKSIEVYGPETAR